jgi:hypothetical protein
MKEELIEEALYNFGLETWKIGKKVSELHIRQGKIDDVSGAFADSFPGILDKAVGDKTKELILFSCMYTFAYGYKFPGFSWEYVESQRKLYLSSEPGDHCRTIFC